MRKLILFFAFAIIGIAATAKPVDLVTAQRVAEHFWQRQANSNANIEAVGHRATFQHLYLFEVIGAKGFVVVAADDIATPILGYSTLHGLGDTINPEAAYWLRCLDEEIAWGIRQGMTALPDVQMEWDRWMGTDPSNPPYETTVSPMVSTTWNQTSYYNNLCPSDASSSYNGHTLTGCVATAMAQIMKKWNHPTTGTGSHSYTHNTYGTLSANFANTTYQWSSMPTSLSSSSSATQKTAVATLMYHCGVSVEMDYGPSSSSAVTNSSGYLTSICAENALMFYFGYSNTIHTAIREGHSTYEWSELLRDELDAGRPILYSGRDVSGGHSFVCDGYNNSGYFHFNWGWGGYCDGYYPITALNPSGSGAGGNYTSSYNLKQKVVLGIQPRTTTPSSVTVTAAASNGTVTGTGSYTFGDTATLLATANSGYRFSQWSDGCYFNPRRVFTSGSITLTPVFVSLNADTLQYERGYQASSFGNSSGNTTYFATKYLPSDFSGHSTLNEILFYDLRSSNYTFYVYKGGTTSPSTLVTSQTVSLTGSEQWVSIPFTQPVSLDSTQTLWIIGSSNANYAGPVSYYGGNENSCYYSSTGSSWTPITYWGYYYSWMMRAVLGNTTTYTITAVPSSTTMGSVTGGGSYTNGSTATLTATANSGYHFTQWQDGNTSNPRTITVTGDATYTAYFAANSTPAANDTLSYCGTNSFNSAIGTGTAGEVYWGISLVPTLLSGHNYLKSVLLYVGYAGTYVLDIYTGGTTAPGTLSHTQTAVFSSSQLGWQEILLDATFPITSTQNLWITFHSTNVEYPASACSYANNTNSDWISVDGVSWSHLQQVASSLVNSWLIKAITSQTVPQLPAPTVVVSGPTNTSTGTATTFTATATSGASITWTLSGATPSTATGNTATATWSTPGTYNVIATATNSYGSSHDTLSVSVIGCNNITTFPYTLTFEENDLSQVNCWTILDADNDGYSWTTDVVDGKIASASYINNIGALSPDNWFISPMIEFSNGYNYALSWSVSAIDTNYYDEHYGVFVSTTGTAPSNFTMLQQYTMNTANEVTHTIDLSAYAGQNVYIAFRHWNVTDVYWMLLDNISITASAVQQYTITVQSADAAMGSVTGGGTYNAGSTVTINATANNGYRFTHWNDGNTSATRTITVTGNTTFTAYFEQIQRYTITVLANNDSWGNVTGGGTYDAGSSVTIRALPYSGHDFLQWNDGNTEATRTITVTGNATYIATFSNTNGIDDIESDMWIVYPNPATNAVTISGVEQATVTVVDMIGRTVATYSVTEENSTIDISQLNRGAYFLHITSDGTTAVRKLIIK